jgi:hypothetical protein
MKVLSSWILVVVMVVAAGCFSGKRGPGTNVGTGTGTGSDNYDGPWNQGGTSPAYVQTP